MHLAQRKHWIFDMDGTLTVPAHDFDAIRDDLGLSPDKPILEQLQDMTEEDAAPRILRLDEIEKEIAESAEPREGAHHLLTTLRETGKRLGILTRNSRDNAWRTLVNCGFDAFFERDDLLGRDCCEPKPSGDGVRKLIAAWNAVPSDAVMVGDYLFDLLAGRDAGVATVLIDPERTGQWAAHADATIHSLLDLHEMIA